MEKTTKKNFLLYSLGFDIHNFFKDKNYEDWNVISFSEILGLPPTILNKLIRNRKFDQFVLGGRDTTTWRFSYFALFFGILSRAKIKYFIDNLENIGYINSLFLSKKIIIFFIHVTFSILLIFFNLIISFLLFIFNFLFIKYKSNYSQNTKKTCIFLRTDNFGDMTAGGSFTHFEGVLCGMKKCGYTMRVYAQKKPGCFNEKETVFFAVPNISFFDFFEIGEIFYCYRFVISVMRDIYNKKIDFLYHRHSIFNFSGALLKYILKIPLILEYNGSEPWAREKWGGKILLKRIAKTMEWLELSAADRIIAISEVLKDDLILRGIDPKKIIINPNGVTCEDFLIDDSVSIALKRKLRLENNIVVGFLGSFGLWHGVDILAKAVKLAVEKNNKLHFVFIGDGVLRYKIETIIREDNMNNFVSFLGIIPHSEVPKYLSMCDILVSPHVPNSDGTRFFGSPTKLFEYMAAGKAIIASNLEQIGSVLEHNKTALLVKPGDINELSNKIINLSFNKDLQISLGIAARKIVTEKYTWEINVRRVLSNLISV